MPWIGTCPWCKHQFTSSSWKQARCPSCFRHVKRHKHGVDL